MRHACINYTRTAGTVAGSLAVLIMLLIAGCTTGEDQGGVSFVFAWPGGGQAMRADFVPMQSLKVQVLAGEMALAAAVVNRPVDSAVSTLPFSNIPAGDLEFRATAYDGLNAVGAILGQARGTLRVVEDQDTTVYLTTLPVSGCELTILPDDAEVYIDRTLQLHVAAVNPDAASVLLPLHTLLWTSSDPLVATVEANTGLVTGVGEGETLITVTDAEYGLQGATMLESDYEPPCVDITADRTRISPGESVILSWESTAADYVVSSVNFNTDLLGGTLTVYPAETTTYRITVAGQGGQDSDSVTVTVDYPAPTVRLTADKTTVWPGEAVRLSWTSEHATVVTDSYNFDATVLNGSTTVYPFDTTTYRVTVQGPGGQASSSVTVTVDVSG